MTPKRRGMAEDLLEVVTALSPGLQPSRGCLLYELADTLLALPSQLAASKKMIEKLIDEAIRCLDHEADSDLMEFTNKLRNMKKRNTLS